MLVPARLMEIGRRSDLAGGVKRVAEAELEQIREHAQQRGGSVAPESQVRLVNQANARGGTTK
jgi:hypothetical protein